MSQFPQSPRLKDVSRVIHSQLSSAVIDPFAFLPHAPGIGCWRNTQAANMFYFNCNDPVVGLPRRGIDWSTVNYIDYKIFPETATVPQQFRLLEHWLAQPTPTVKFLHISIDYEQLDCLTVLEPFTDLRYRGLLAVQILNRGLNTVDVVGANKIAHMLPTNRLLALDYHNHCTHPVCWFMDLQAPFFKRIYYTL